MNFTFEATRPAALYYADHGRAHGHAVIDGEVVHFYPYMGSERREFLQPITWPLSRIDHIAWDTMTPGVIR